MFTVSQKENYHSVVWECKYNPEGAKKMTKRKWLLAALGFSAGLSLTAVNGFSNGIIHDAEFVKLQEQHGEKWAVEDKALDQKLAALKAKHGKSPNIIHLMWDDSGYGDVGSPLLTRIHGIDTPNIAKMADEGISFTRMYTEPSCTPTRAAALTGRHPIRSGWRNAVTAALRAIRDRRHDRHGVVPGR